MSCCDKENKASAPETNAEQRSKTNIPKNKH
jgi:hypothetical protein